MTDNYFRGIGYNVNHASVPFDKVILDMKNSGSAYHVVMTESQNGLPSRADFDTIWRYHNELYPIYGDRLLLLWRFFNNKQGKFREYDSKVYQSVLGNNFLPPSVVIDSLSNEPELNGSSYTTNEDYVRHELQVLRDLKAVGVKYAIGAFSTGTPHEMMINKGVYDDLLKEAEYMSMHFYNIFPFESGETWDFNILNKNDANREIIRGLYFNKTKWPSGYKGWWFGRLGFWEARCKYLNIDMPTVLESEGVTDYIETVPTDIRTNWMNNFGIGDYKNKPEGIASFVKYFEWLFPDMTLEQILKMILLHIRENIHYQKYIGGIALYGYNRNWSYNGHNWEISLFDNFRTKHLKEVNMTITETEPVKKYDTIWSTSISNVRREPNTSSEFPPIWYLQLEKESVTILDENVEGVGNKYKWVKFLRHKDGNVYYVAKTAALQYINVEESVDEPRYVVDLLDMTQIFTKSDLEELKELFVSIHDFVADIDDEEKEDKAYLVDLFSEFLDMRKEASEGNKEATLVFLDRIVKGIEKAQAL